MSQWTKGKEITLIGGNAVNDIKVLYPEIFEKHPVFTEIRIEFPEKIQVSFTSSDGVDTDYDIVDMGEDLTGDNLSITNIKIKSENSQTGFIYLGGI